MHFVTQCVCAHKSWNAQKYPGRGLLNQFSINIWGWVCNWPTRFFKGCEIIDLWSWNVWRYAIRRIKWQCWDHSLVEHWKFNHQMAQWLAWRAGVNNQNLAEYNITACAKKEAIDQNYLTTLIGQDRPLGILSKTKSPRGLRLVHPWWDFVLRALRMVI